MAVIGKKKLREVLDQVLDIAFKTDAVIVIKGETGIGKTFLVNKIAEQRNWDLLVRVLSNSTIEEIIGVPVVHESEGTKYFSKLIPSWLEPVYDHSKSKPIILFLDEINRRVIPEQVLFSILDRKLVAGKKFRKNVILVACINSGDNYNVQELEDRSLKNRFIMIDFQMDTDDIINMIIELGDESGQQELTQILILLIKSIQQNFGEFHDMFVSLRNWKNFFYFLVNNKISNLKQMGDVLATNEFVQYIISNVIIVQLREKISEIENKYPELIEKHYKKNEKLPLNIQFETQNYFISQMISCAIENLPDIIKKIIVINDNVIVISIIKNVYSYFNKHCIEKNSVIITTLNELGIIENLKSAF